MCQILGEIHRSIVQLYICQFVLVDIIQGLKMKEKKKQQQQQQQQKNNSVSPSLNILILHSGFNTILIMFAIRI